MIRRGAAILIALTGCRPATPIDSTTIRDSAGVRIVESHRPAAPGSITIDSTPTVDIGGEHAGAESEFVSMIASAHRFPDGRIVASGWATTTFKMFDSTGMWIRNVGRKGSGPGEFEGLGWVYPSRGDTLVTFEPGRLQWFNSAGTFLRFQTPTARIGVGGGWIRAVFDDGSMLAELTAGDSPIGRDKVIRRVTVLKRYWPGQARYDSIMSYLDQPGLEHPQYPGSIVSGLTTILALPGSGYQSNGHFFDPRRSVRGDQIRLGGSR